jgi:hypothetical protein
MARDACEIVSPILRQKKTYRKSYSAHLSILRIGKQSPLSDGGIDNEIGLELVEKGRIPETFLCKKKNGTNYY